MQLFLPANVVPVSSWELLLSMGKLTLVPMLARRKFRVDSPHVVKVWGN